ncbi:MAG: type II toxin-antitoxin system RelE/ParE family toxin [Chloroflexota bacterium]|nr:type II toxin-antitoxin system RelE/ParE family toxin [Chloroflexota bacterium]
MPYEIELTEDSKRDIQTLRSFERRNVLAAIERHLRHEPTKESQSRIKRLRELARPQYRLRVDDIGIFYDIVGEVVEIIAVIAKADAAVWLAQAGIATDPNAPGAGEE